MRGWRQWWWTGLVLWLALAAPALAQPIRLTHEAGTVALDGRAVFWTEEGRKLDPSAVEERAAQLPWTVRRPGTQHHLDDRTLSVRFDAVVADQDRWYLAIGSSGVDRAQLFYRDEAGRWVTQEAGDTLPVSQWPVPGRIPTFELSPNMGRPVTYWLRVQQDRVDFAAGLTLHNQAQLLVVREREQFLLGGYFGVAALLAAVAIGYAIAWRDRNFSAYAVYLVSFTLGQAAYLGVSTQHLWDQWLGWNNTSTFLLPALSVPAGLWFVQVVTEPARFSRRLHQGVTAMILLLLVAAVVDILWPTRPVMLVRMLLTSVAIALIAGLIALVWLKGDRDVRLITLGFVPVLVMALFPIARGMNLIPNSVLTRYGLTIGAAVEMPILFYALSLRALRRRQGLVRASALPHTDALTGLADRRSLLERMERSLAQARGQGQCCALLAVRLANQDAIAGDHGRDGVDRALIVAAALLRSCATDTDMAARVGDREFALFLEGPATPDSATARAQQVVAGGLRPTPALPPDVTLRLQVAIAMLPHPEHADSHASLHWALGALAQVPPDARKQIRPLNF